ncbi:MAG: alpha/beta fold hydrolase [Gemmatimonadaceae bacterium]|nr:alpha/beta fold hydrolase [Gemmatimonadaceae bacterium]
MMRSNARRFEADHAARLPQTADGSVVGAEDIVRHADTRRAALLVHGFNDTPQSMAYLAGALHRAGWTVHVPRLPGHGVSLRRMAREARYGAWTASVEQTYQQLRATHDVVVVCGQSMGGALATLLAAQHHEIPALVLLAPYLRMPRRIELQTLLAWLFRPLGEYRAGRGGDRSIHDPAAKSLALGPRVITARMMTELRTTARRAYAALPQLRSPTLYVQSREDNRITSHTAEDCFARIGSTQKVQRWVTGSGHIISADYCKDDIAEQVIAWFSEACALR